VAGTRQAFRTECDPARVSAAINRLYAERRARPRLPVTGGTDFEALAVEADWTAGWWERLREQHRRSGEWARFTGQPYSIRQAIDDAERLALRKSLAARARAGRWERCASSVAMSGVVA
jgi:hypothetical protein